MAKGFNMKVVAYDVYHDDAFAKEMDFPYLSLEDVLAASDVITIHAPYLPSTHHLINASNVHLIKKGAILINTARGAIVETAALITALKDGTLAGAGIDVLEEEAEMKAGDMSVDAELVAMPNVIVTPHNAFNTREAFLRILDTTIDNIVAFVAGVPINVVNAGGARIGASHCAHYIIMHENKFTQRTPHPRFPRSWTVEVSLTLQNGVRATASVPQGKSTGATEAHALSAARR